MKMVARGAIVAVIALMMAAMVSTAGVSAAPASADAAVEGPARVTAAAQPCGHLLRFDPPEPSSPVLWRVTYRHCTSGSDSIRVKAIIRFHADGSCVTVGPRQTRQIDTYWFPSGVFDRIARC
jgi:hypothetical protein